MVAHIKCTHFVKEWQARVKTLIIATGCVRGYIMDSMTGPPARISTADLIGILSEFCNLWCIAKRTSTKGIQERMIWYWIYNQRTWWFIPPFFVPFVSLNTLRFWNDTAIQIKRLLNTADAAKPNIRLPSNALTWGNCTGLLTGMNPAITGRMVLNSLGVSLSTGSNLVGRGPMGALFIPVAGSRRIVRPNNLNTS